MKRALLPGIIAGIVITIIRLSWEITISAKILGPVDMGLIVFALIRRPVIWWSLLGSIAAMTVICYPLTRPKTTPAQRDLERRI